LKHLKFIHVQIKTFAALVIDSLTVHIIISSK